jgi:integrase
VRVRARNGPLLGKAARKKGDDPMAKAKDRAIRDAKSGKSVEALLRPGAEPGRYAAGNNLYLKVGKGDARSWVYWFRWQGRPTETGLGSAHNMGLAAARTGARACRTQLDAGIKPGSPDGTAPGTAPLFGAVADAVIAAKAKAWKGDGHRKRWTYALSRRRDKEGALDGSGFCKAMIGKPCNTITETDVLAVLAPIWLSKAKSAALLRTMIEAVLHAGGRRGADNPAALENLRHSLPKQPTEVVHCAAMPYKDAPAFLAKLRACDDLGARGLEFCILTWTRSDETRVALRSEIDRDNALWIIPAHRTKKSREHRIPLSPRALAIVDELDRTRPADNPYLFPGLLPRQPISRTPMPAIMERLGAGAFTVHGWRSTARDWAGETTSHPHDICEAALAHKRKDKTHAAYQRGDLLERRRKLMNDWEAFCMGTQRKPATRHLRRRRIMFRRPAAVPALALAA